MVILRAFMGLAFEARILFPSIFRGVVSKSVGIPHREPIAKDREARRLACPLGVELRREKLLGFTASGIHEHGSSVPFLRLNFRVEEEHVLAAGGEETPSRVGNSAFVKLRFPKFFSLAAQAQEKKVRSGLGLG